MNNDGDQKELLKVKVSVERLTENNSNENYENNFGLSQEEVQKLIRSQIPPELVKTVFDYMKKYDLESYELSFKA